MQWVGKMGIYRVIGRSGDRAIGKRQNQEQIPRRYAPRNDNATDRGVHKNRSPLDFARGQDDKFQTFVVIDVAGDVLQHQALALRSCSAFLSDAWVIWASESMLR